MEAKLWLWLIDSSHAIKRKVWVSEEEIKVVCEGYENEIFGGSLSFWLFHGSSSLSLGCTIIAGCTNEYQISSCQYQAVKNHVLLPCQRSWKLDSFLSVPKNKLIITIPFA